MFYSYSTILVQMSKCVQMFLYQNDCRAKIKAKLCLVSFWIDENLSSF